MALLPTVDPQEHAFLRAIQEAPGDDGLRLHLADWLEERGDPRGEFIRVQVALADPELADDRRLALAIRERGLLALYEQTWLGPLGQVVASWEFRRGFIDLVTFEARAFLAQGTIVRDCLPVPRIGLCAVGRLLPRLLSCAHLDQVAVLDLKGTDLGDSGIEMLAGCSGLTGLRRLDVSLNLLETRGAKVLAASASLAGLEELNLGHNPIGDMGVYALAHSSHIKGLTSLDLSFCDLGPTGARGLAGASGLGGLKVLDLNHNEIGDEGVRFLVASAHLTQLQELRLRGNGLGPRGLQALAAAASWTRLRFLDLAENALTFIHKDALRHRFGDDVCRW